jgi:hypothetical protein
LTGSASFGLGDFTDIYLNTKISHLIETSAPAAHGSIPANPKNFAYHLKKVFWHFFCLHQI